ncbi:hypothetical protein [Streptomyces sp. NPDC051219]|uniref:hypothetical protein n=1 Tax=Streptomyces sp. NPDC051219 TaxID=3155283 RepID=UPI00342316BE
MPASEREAQSRSSQSRPRPVVSMRDLLASCAAATAVSTPPREPQAARKPGQEQGQGRAAA